MLPHRGISASLASTFVRRDCISLSRESSLPVRLGAQYRSRKDAKAVHWDALQIPTSPAVLVKDSRNRTSLARALKKSS